MSFITCALAACQPTARLMPAPALFASGEHSPFASMPAADKTNLVEVFYATNRLPVGPRGARVYTPLPGQTLHAGTARVRIGPRDKPWEALYAASTSPATRPALKLDAVDEIAAIRDDEPIEQPSADARAFFAAIDAALARSSNEDLTIYVHGSNSTVELASAQAAQFRHFMGRSAVVLVFIWPSAGSILRYFTDVGHARLSVPVFDRLCDWLLRHTTAEHLNVLAYSAGAQIVSPALAALGSRARWSHDQAQLRLGEVYLAAPDIALRSFVVQLPQYIGATRRVTVSANLSDAALGLSKWLHGASRLGNPDPSELSETESRQLVDAAARMQFDLISVKPEVIPGLPRRSHAFWYEHPWVSSDVLMKFLFHIPPGARGLDLSHTADGFPYWTFPSDYDRRVVAIKRQLRSDPSVSTPIPFGASAASPAAGGRHQPFHR